MSKQIRFSKEECLRELARLVEEALGKPVTRQVFRKNSRIPESTCLFHFGTFGQFMIAAGLRQTKDQSQLQRHIAKHQSVDSLRQMTIEKNEWAGKYLRPHGTRFQTVLVGSDIHDIECDPFWRKLFLETAQRVQPEKVVLNGDIFDLPEFSKYNVDPREWDVVGRIKWVHKFLEELRKAVPETEIVFIEGNHECVGAKTEVLTTDGWLTADNVKLTTKLVTQNLISKNLEEGYPKAVKLLKNQNLLNLSGDLHDEVVSTSHNVILDGRRTPVKDLNHKTDQTRFTYSALNPRPDLPFVSDDDLRIITWLIADGTMLKRQVDNCRLQWKLSRKDKIDSLEALLVRMGIAYTIRDATRSASNKLQPKYICVYGGQARKYYKVLEGQKTYPEWFKTLSSRQVRVVLDTLSHTDGGRVYNHLLMSTSKKAEAEFLQYLCFTNGIPSRIDSRINQGFSKNRIYKVSIFDRGVCQRRKVIKTERGKGTVVAIQTSTGSLVTRRNGKIVVTGNCRLLRHLSEASPAIRTVLSDLHGWTVPQLLGLDKFQVRYIAPADLAVFTKADTTAQLRRNWVNLYDCLIAHHFPEGANFGLPGWNGHHHSHKVTAYYSAFMGPYEWHQLGSGHKRGASYCNGEKWTNGFLLVHVDTLNKKSQFEYIDTTHDHVVIGGKWYHRD